MRNEEIIELLREIGPYIPLDPNSAAYKAMDKLWTYYTHKRRVVRTPEQIREDIARRVVKKGMFKSSLLSNRVECIRKVYVRAKATSLPRRHIQMRTANLSGFMYHLGGATEAMTEALEWMVENGLLRLERGLAASSRNFDVVDQDWLAGTTKPACLVALEASDREVAAFERLKGEPDKTHYGSSTD